MTQRGELARATGISNPEAGLGNWALVDEGFATQTVTRRLLFDRAGA